MWFKLNLIIEINLKKNFEENKIFNISAKLNELKLNKFNPQYTLCFIYY